MLWLLVMTLLCMLVVLVQGTSTTRNEFFFNGVSATIDYTINIFISLYREVIIDETFGILWCRCFKNKSIGRSKMYIHASTTIIYKVWLPWTTIALVIGMIHNSK
jgi:predicted branched-subunit amino acid permease